jgi:hypothetical protein
MSLFDPETSDERLDQLRRDSSGGSGEPVPELSQKTREHLKAELLRIGAKMARASTPQEGLEEAYGAFADAFRQSGVALTEPLLHLDIPNMLFNCAVMNGWFPYLTSLIGQSHAPGLTSANRIPYEKLGTKGGVGGLTVPDKRESFIWFKDNIRPAVLEWTAKALEATKKHDPSDEPNPLQASRRRRWLQTQLDSRGWTTGDLQKYGGPDRKTSETYMSGANTSITTMKKIVDSLNGKPLGRLIDISEVPR